MKIYFEGVSCSGKSTLIKTIEQSRRGIISISELPDDYKKHEDLDNFCRYNDERKCLIANEKSKMSIVLVDRGYASTLAYNYIQLKLSLSQEYFKTLDWYLEGIKNGKLLKPDFYVLLSVDKKTAINRAKKLNRFCKTIAWYNNPLIGNNFYKYFFSLLEPDIPLLSLDGKIPVEKLLKEFWRFIDEHKK